MVDALVLAGGRLETDRFPGLDPALACKSQVPLAGKPMVWWPVSALRKCPGIGRIAVCGPDCLDTPDLRALNAAFVPEREGICENLRAGMDALPGAARLLVISADLPLLTREALEDFLAGAPDADVVFPYAERADIERDFPDRKWIFANTPDGSFTGCSAFLCRTESILARWEWVENLLGARRRKIFGLLMLLGPAFILKYATGRLRISDVEARMSQLLHLDARGYRTRFTELAMDVDKLSDIPFVEAILCGRAE